MELLLKENGVCEVGAGERGADEENRREGNS